VTFLLMGCDSLQFEGDFRILVRYGVVSSLGQGPFPYKELCCFLSFLCSVKLTLEPGEPTEIRLRPAKFFFIDSVCLPDGNFHEGAGRTHLEFR